MFQSSTLQEDNIQKEVPLPIKNQGSSRVVGPRVARRLSTATTNQVSEKSDDIWREGEDELQLPESRPEAKSAREAQIEEIIVPVAEGGMQGPKAKKRDKMIAGLGQTKGAPRELVRPTGVFDFTEIAPGQTKKVRVYYDKYVYGQDLAELVTGVIICPWGVIVQSLSCHCPVTFVLMPFLCVRAIGRFCQEITSTGIEHDVSRFAH